MKGSSDIVIVGAGMVGLAAANLLSHNGQFAVTLIDAGKQARFSRHDDVALRVSALSPGSVELLSAIGVWDEIVAHRVCPYREMRVWDTGDYAYGAGSLEFAAAEFALPQLGFIAENELIRYVLQKQLRSTGAAIYFETSLESIKSKSSRYEIALSSGKKLTPELLIGADGAKSIVRNLAEISLKTWPHAQKAFVTHLQPEYDHQETAWQRFTSDGPLGLLPLSDGRVSAVWSTQPTIADAALAMSDESLGKKLGEVSDGVLGHLMPAGPRGAFPLVSQHAARYVRPGLALLGDAAHAIHPLAGQGVNLGFADVAQLAATLEAEHRRGESIGDLPVLRKYERARKGANQTMLVFLDGLNRLFANDSRAVTELRGAGMRLFNSSGPIRKRVVRVALGIN